MGKGYRCVLNIDWRELKLNKLFSFFESVWEFWVWPDHLGHPRGLPINLWLILRVWGEVSFFPWTFKESVSRGIAESFCITEGCPNGNFQRLVLNLSSSDNLILDVLRGVTSNRNGQSPPRCDGPAQFQTNYESGSPESNLAFSPPLPWSDSWLPRWPLLRCNREKCPSHQPHTVWGPVTYHPG